MENSFLHQMIARVDWNVYLKTVRNCGAIQIYCWDQFLSICLTFA